MNDSQRGLFSSAFSLLVIGLAAFVTQRFFLPLVWAAILCIATWPLYRKLLERSGGRSVIAAILLTVLMACVFLIPALLGLAQVIEQASVAATFFANANNNGIAPPAALQRIPLISDYIQQWWQVTLAQPHGLTHLFSENSVGKFVSASGVLKSIGSQLFHRLLDFGFVFLCLFFFYKDGLALNRQIVQIGARCFGQQRWDHFYQKIPTAIRATVDGLVLVGLGEGLLIGIAYAFAGLHSPALWGAATGVLAIVPFGAPVVFLSAAALLLADGHTAAAIGITLWGTAVLFVADHLIRPSVIGSATRLPFLAVLFGIVGGLETMGLVGLFIGPVIMVLLTTLWREAVGANEDGAKIENV